MESPARHLPGSEMPCLERGDDGSAENLEKSLALTRATEELKEVMQARPTTSVATLDLHKRKAVRIAIMRRIRNVCQKLLNLK